MNTYGASFYKRVAVDAGVNVANPHELILMLYDGAIEAIRVAEGALAKGNVPLKGSAIGKAVRIVEEGLKASVDRSGGGALAQHLAQLYDYCTMRLLQAQLRNDLGALREVARLLDQLRDAWRQIGTAPAPKAATAPREARVLLQA